MEHVSSPQKSLDKTNGKQHTLLGLWLESLDNKNSLKFSLYQPTGHMVIFEKKTQKFNILQAWKEISRLFQYITNLKTKKNTVMITKRKKITMACYKLGRLKHL